MTVSSVWHRIGTCSGEKVPEVALTRREQQRQEYVYPPTMQGLNSSILIKAFVCVKLSEAHVVVGTDRLTSVDKILWTCRVGQLWLEVTAT